MKIPFMRLDRQYALHKNEILSICDNVFSHGKVLQGKEVESLENKLSEIHRAKHSVAVNSGTDALYFALVSLGVLPGDKVIVPSLSFIASASPVERIGAIPVFVDSTLQYHSDIDQIINRIKKDDIKCVIFVHLYGELVDLSSLYEECKKYNVILIEDGAQALGSVNGDYILGDNSDAATLSFDPMKIAGAYGSGGAVITKSDFIQEEIVKLRYHGRDVNRHYINLGYNSQMSSLQAAIIEFKIKKMTHWTNKRINISKKYESYISGGMIAPKENNNITHVYHKYAIRCTENNRDEIKSHLSRLGIQTMIHYEKPIYAEPMFASYKLDKNQFPVTEKLTNELLSLPIYPELLDEEVDFVGVSLSKFS
ncbi:MAG: hypothetical protein CL774_01910 [Chloroflexi bacterium]|nr:hypothetical protein [Chloroflexota bacterium]|tara:strand:+ start:28104 stop:29204 length:1101 start_codon:yes stop_codon:yes gene_type:complete